MELFGFDAGVDVERRVGDAFFCLQRVADNCASWIQELRCRARRVLQYFNGLEIATSCEGLEHDLVHEAGIEDAKCLGFERVTAGSNAICCQIVKILA
ncbi:hypothetical protein D3C72_1977140 [compost metagenome]